MYDIFLSSVHNNSPYITYLPSWRLRKCFALYENGGTERGEKKSRGSRKFRFTSNLNISIFSLNVGSSRFCTKIQFCARWCAVTSYRTDRAMHMHMHNL